MKNEIVVFISDGYADWEIGFICPVLNRANFKVSTLALSRNSVTSMGGLQITPDYSIEDLLQQKQIDISMLLLCGGEIWKQQNYILPELKKVIDLCQNNKVLIAAICDATTFLANNGYLNKIAHTGNSVEFIVEKCPQYIGKEHYLQQQCVSSNHIITANGTATLEFTKQIMLSLKAMPNTEIQSWYEMHKKGWIDAHSNIGK